MRVGVALVNWNNSGDTIACIHSLKQASVVPERILVWDNASRDESVQSIRAAHPDVTVIRSDENIGFALANNSLYQQLQEQGMDYVWILNNDTLVGRDCLRLMLSAFTENPAAVVVTGIIFYPEPENTVWYAGGELLVRTMSARHLKQPLLWHNPFSVTFASGCCMLIQTRLFMFPYLFAPHFFAYYEDVELCFRLLQAGARILCVPNAHLVHKVSASVRRNAPFAGQCSALQHYYQARNHLFVIRLHSPATGAKCLALALALVTRLKFMVMNLCLLRLKKVAAIARGVYIGCCSPAGSGM